MHRSILLMAFSGLVVPVLFTPAAGAGPGAEACPVTEKISTLLAGWNQAAEEAKALSEAERAKLEARCAGLASECPIGSRVGGTLLAAREVFTGLKAAEEACAKLCPLAAAAEKGGAKSEACAAALELKAARTKLLHDLQLLASRATETFPASRGQGTAAGKTAEASGPADPSTSRGEPTCLKELADRVGALKSSWEKAGLEVQALTTGKRQEILTGFEELARSSRAVALVPQTVLALGEGFDALEAIQGKMSEWARANPDLLQSASEEAKRSFESQQALIHQTREVFHTAREAMKALHPPAGQTAAKEKPTLNVGTARPE